MLASALLAMIGVGINARLVASMPRVPLPRPSATALRELERGKPVRITVVNTLDEPTGESFPDGVAGWSGLKDRIMPPVVWRLEVKSVETVWYIPLTVIVTAPFRERPRQ